MNNSESGRKLNHAVNTTSKAVGGAFSMAKGAFSNLWSSMTTPPIILNTPPKFSDDACDEYSTAKPAVADNTNTRNISINIENEDDTTRRLSQRQTVTQKKNNEGY